MINTRKKQFERTKLFWNTKIKLLNFQREKFEIKNTDGVCIREAGEDVHSADCRRRRLRGAARALPRRLGGVAPASRERGDHLWLFSLLGKLYCKECDSINVYDWLDGRSVESYWKVRTQLTQSRSEDSGGSFTSPIFGFIQQWCRFLSAGCRHTLYD